MKNISLSFAQLSAAATLLAVAMPSQAQVIYSTGFEPPTYSPGPAGGQGGWSGGGVIEDTQVQSGTQALEGTGDFALARYVNYAVGGSTVILQSDFMNTGSDSTFQSGLALYSNTGFLAQLYDFGGVYYLGDYSQGTTPQYFAPDVWHQLDIELN
jgi:hypothetical protein